MPPSSAGPSDMGLWVLSLIVSAPVPSVPDEIGRRTGQVRRQSFTRAVSSYAAFLRGTWSIFWTSCSAFASIRPARAALRTTAELLPRNRRQSHEWSDGSAVDLDFEDIGSFFLSH
jgi:hypothetical protein